jgi:hypothetical protein
LSLRTYVSFHNQNGKAEGGGGPGAAGYNIIIKEASPECLHNTIEAKFMHMAIMCYPTRGLGSLNTSILQGIENTWKQ